MTVLNHSGLQVCEEGRGYGRLRILPGRISNLFRGEPRATGVSRLSMHLDFMNDEWDGDGDFFSMELTKEDALALIGMLSDALYTTEKNSQTARGNIHDNHREEMSKANEKNMQLRAKIDELTPEPKKAKTKAKPKSKKKGAK